MSQKNYKGLQNIGATCYINTFIQTLFMTPEFRDRIYSWKYNQKIHPKRQDSILYQLQKLFGKLQLGATNISTKQLTKSFQWHDNEHNDEQDVQEFNRILFQAIEKSLQKETLGKYLIKQLYQGELVHFTKCLQCHTESTRQQYFQDLILNIKNIYEKIYNHNIELCLQRYIKPQLLDENNLYDCSICNKKVRAQRGLKFIRLPKLINIVLQRFNFDYYTMTKNKVNDKCTFPFVLNFNNYLHGYEQIPNKLQEDSSDYFINEEINNKKVMPPSKPLMNKSKIVSKNGTNVPSVAGKVKTKPSANTKSFLQEMRKKKFGGQMQNQDLIFVSGNSSIPENKTSTNGQTLSKSQVHQKIEQHQTMKAQDKNFIPPPPPLLLLHNLVPPQLTECFNASKITTKNQSKIKQQDNMTMDKEVQSKINQKEELKINRQKCLTQLTNKNRQLIDLYLKDGSSVYQLYSILVHSGTANAGHYFGYIKSLQNQKWYSFNDYNVSQINVVQIQKTFGGSGLSSAYVLYYRLIQKQAYKSQFSIPQYIFKQISDEQQNKKIKMIQKNLNLENILILKIYFQLGVKSIQINKTSNLQLLFQKCKEMFNIKMIKDYSEVGGINEKFSYVKEGNLRIRLFNPVNDTKLDTYTGKQQLNLYQLGIRSYQNFLLQIKADSEEFQEYIAGFMSIRIACWQDNPNILSLEQKNIRLHKVSIGRDYTMKQVEQVIICKRRQLFPQKDKLQSIFLIKRHQNDEFLYHEIVNLIQYHNKTIQTVGIFESEIIFVQEQSDKLKWPSQFQNQINRISIKFYNSINGQTQNILTDSRITLNQLKVQICGLIKESIDEIIIKRGTKSGLELKNGELSLKDNRFINGTSLYLQKGLPAKAGQIRVQLFFALDASRQLYNRLHQFQYITDIPIDTQLKASQVKIVLANIMKKYRNIQLDSANFRIRQKVNDKIGKIYRQKPMKQQQLIEKRQIAIQMKEDKLDIKDYSIYVRVWDQINWKLSQKFQFFVNKNTTMKTLAKNIYNFLKQQQSEYLIDVQQIDVCRILSIHKFNILDLVDMEYFGMTSEVCVLGEPLFVNSDGLLYIIKQTGIQPRELTKEQENIFGGQVKSVIRPTKGRSTGINSHNIKKQKGITIKVIQKMEQN